MLFKYLTNVPLQEAKQNYLQTMLDNNFKADIENIEVINACHRVSASAVYANISAPHYNSSAMDGVGVVAKNTFGASQTSPIILNQNQYIMLDTGDPIPEAYDAIIMMEDIVFLDDGQIKIHTAATPFQHIRQIGEDICQGEMILPSYTTINAAAIGSMLAAGVLNVDVLQKPLIGIIPTGNEVISPKSTPKTGDIIEFNSAIFNAMLKDLGADCKIYPICKDDFNALKSALELALSQCDIVIINAGSSAGREDYTVKVIEDVGTVLYHGIAIKPGKPAILGYSQGYKQGRSQSCQAILGVPGYPVSGIIVIEEILKPLLEQYTKLKNPEAQFQEAILARPIISGVKHKEFIRVRMGLVQDRYIASPLSRGSGVISSFMKADGILEVAQGLEGYFAGQKVDIRLLQPLNKIDNSLVVIGSHDPLLDEIGDMLHISDENLYMNSSHVGSMGGIMAIKREEAHLGGIHLLDENDGTYNISYVNKHFPEGGVSLIQGFGRTQGFMLSKGNPKNIRCIQDIYNSNVRFINRQKGSGTRILFDYLNKQVKLDVSKINGYGREEFTHTAIAAQISLNSGDVGMGIYSAAKMFELDFIPICVEQYDFLVPHYALNTIMVQNFLKILKSDAFRTKANSLGGYVLDNPGKVII